MKNPERGRVAGRDDELERTGSSMTLLYIDFSLQSSWASVIPHWQHVRLSAIHVMINPRFPIMKQHFSALPGSLLASADATKLDQTLVSQHS